MDYPKSSIHAPLWIIGVLGGLFTACGHWLMLHGAKGPTPHVEYGTGQTEAFAQPMALGLPLWPAQGITAHKFKESLHGVIVWGVFAGFLAPFNWMRFSPNRAEYFGKS